MEPDSELGAAEWRTGVPAGCEVDIIIWLTDGLA